MVNISDNNTKWLTHYIVSYIVNKCIFGHSYNETQTSGCFHQDDLKSDRQAALSKHVWRWGTCPHLDVLRALQQPLVKPSGVVVLLLLNLKVNVRLPQHLGVLIHLIRITKYFQKHLWLCNIWIPSEGDTGGGGFTSGMSRRGWPMASSKMARALSVSPRMVSSSANLIQVVQFSGANSRYFSYSFLQRSNSLSCSSSSM